MLYLVFVFGDALSNHIGLWSWPVLLAALSATVFVRRRVFAFGGATEPGPEPSRTDKPVGGMIRQTQFNRRLPPLH
jgi:hypothetical protein